MTRGRELPAELGNFGVSRLEVAVEQARGTEDHLSEIADFAPVLLHRGDVIMDVAGDVIGCVGIFRALAINVRFDRLDGFDRGGVRNEHDVVDAGERREGAGAERVVEIRDVQGLC